jgi:hypothetical protein
MPRPIRYALGMALSPQDLAALDAAEEITIETRASDGTPHRTIIWVVVAAGEGYVRSVRGERGRWYREAQADPNVVIRVDGRAINARAVPVTSQESISTVTAAIEEKYTGIPGLEPMLRPDVLDATLRLESA